MSKPTKIVVHDKKTCHAYSDELLQLAATRHTASQLFTDWPIPAGYRVLTYCPIAEECVDQNGDRDLQLS